jgi:hypothetical protein
MVEALLTVLDRLIQLIKGRIEGRRNVFDRVIEPTFNELLQIHGDYVQMFEEAQVFTAAGVTNEVELQRRIAAAKQELQDRRREFEPVRRKVEAIAIELASHSLPEEERRFVDAVMRYLPSGDPALPHSASTTLLQYLETAAPESIDRVIAATIQRHRNAWSEVCTEYAKVRLLVARAR